MDSVILTTEALKLSAWERAKVIDALWQSLDPVGQAEIDQSWLLESKERLGAYRAGKLEALDGETVLKSIESELRK